MSSRTRPSRSAVSIESLGTGRIGKWFAELNTGLPRGFSGTFITNLGILASGLISGVLTARVLGPEGRGELAAIIFWPSLIASVGIFGFNWSLARQAAQRPDHAGLLARIGVVHGLTSGCILMFIGWATLPVLLGGQKADLISIARLFLPYIPINLVMLNMLAVDQGAGRFKSFNRARLLFYPVYLASIIAIWLSGSSSVVLFIVATLCAHFVSVSVRLSSCDLRLRQQQPLGYPHIVGVAQSGVSFGYANVIRMASQHLDQFLVVVLLHPADIGLYAVALAFASAHAPLANALNTATFAQSAGLERTQSRSEALAKTVKRAALLYAFTTIVAAACAPILIVPLFGKDFATASVPAAFLVFATAITAVAGVIDEGLRGAGYTRPGMLAQGAGAITTASCAWLLVDGIGLRGIAASALIGASVQLMTLLLYWLTGQVGIGREKIFQLDGLGQPLSKGPRGTLRAAPNEYNGDNTH